MGRHLSPRYGQVVLVSGCPVLTVAIDQYIDVQYVCIILSTALSVFLCSQARKYEIEHRSRSSKTIIWSADSFQINNVTSMS